MAVKPKPAASGGFESPIASTCISSTSLTCFQYHCFTESPSTEVTRILSANVSTRDNNALCCASCKASCNIWEAESFSESSIVATIVADTPAACPLLAATPHPCERHRSFCGSCGDDQTPQDRAANIAG